MTLGAPSFLPAFLATIRDSLAERFLPRPIASVDGLARFTGARAAYVGQTSLYGYLKTRMGTRFPEYFEDAEFSASIRSAAVRVFVSCAGDLTVYAVALAGGQGRLDAAASAALARRCFGGALEAGLGIAGGDAPADAAARFADRAERVLWANAAHGMAAFDGSAEDVIRYAPVTDQFKALDHAIVRNSIRFRWLDIREQLARRLDAAAVCADWRARSAA